MRSLTGCLLFAAVLFASGAVSAEQSLETHRINFDKEGFSVVMPSTWPSQQQDLSQFTMFTCAATTEGVNPSPLATITLMFGGREKGHDELFEKVIGGIPHEKIISRGKTSVPGGGGALDGEWVLYTQSVEQGGEAKVKVFYYKDTKRVFIFICQSPVNTFERYSAVFDEVGKSLKIR